MKDLAIETARERLAVCENIGWLHQNTKSLSGVFSDDTNSDMNSDDDISRSMSAITGCHSLSVDLCVQFLQTRPFNLRSAVSKSLVYHQTRDILCELESGMTRCHPGGRPSWSEFFHQTF